MLALAAVADGWLKEIAAGNPGAAAVVMDAVSSICCLAVLLLQQRTSLFAGVAFSAQ